MQQDEIKGSYTVLLFSNQHLISHYIFTFEIFIPANVLFVLDYISNRYRLLYLKLLTSK